MALTAPQLDDRHFQDLVDEAKKRIPHYTSEWTDHNVSDPGITLIELFAWLTETTLYRLNRVPERHYVKFMEMLGITLKSPVPAKAPVTFWLSGVADTDLMIQGGTEVASTQTETERSIVFTTNEDFIVSPPKLKTVLSHITVKGDRAFKSAPRLSALETGLTRQQQYQIFSDVPQVDDALYFGFENDLSNHILRLEMGWDNAGGAGPNPDLPPYVWEAGSHNPDRPWLPCHVETDTTRAMNSNGRVQIHLPKMGPQRVNNQKLYWVRARVKPISRREKEDGMKPYTGSPILIKVTNSTHGGVIMATHAQMIRDEFLGQSDGSAGQQYHLQVTPILGRRPDEQLTVHVDGEGVQTWQEVKDFAEADADSPQYALDNVTGELRFGPAIRQPDGAIKLYGRIPPRGSNLIFKKYRYGGGEEGNVEAGILNTLKTAIPYVGRVSNRQPAWGGLDAETLEDAMVRAPQVMRHRDRAVTATDYEELALQTPEVTIGRVKCLQPEPSEAGRVAPGQVYVLIIPRVRYPEKYLTPDDLQPEETDIQKLEAFLDERRLLTTRLFIRPPAYRWVAAQVRLRANPDAEQTDVEEEVLARLYRFLNPLTGGPKGKGWPFGRELFLSDVYQSLQGMANVQFIRSVELFVTEAGSGPQEEPVETVEVVAHGIIASGVHEVEFV
ncbi:MAG: putative baseplate assembly protein [Chloroflexi bacterium]|nr:putative baseplate assembly protein [Chloroflexota bacterium]